MGLDAYVRVKKTKKVTKEIWYGRKENEIHGWMQRKSGIPAEEFNCLELPLTKELLDELETDVSAGLPETTGFFFGSGNNKEGVAEAAKDLINAARLAIADGREPFYFSWW